MLYSIYALIVMSVFLTTMCNRTFFPFFVIFNRWIRWVLFSLGTAYFLKTLDLVNKPFWVLFLSAFVIWFMVDSIYHWMAICSLNKSDLPLFPSFREDSQDNFWPAASFFIKVKEDIIEKGFVRKQNWVTTEFFGLKIRSVIFENTNSTERLQVIFFQEKQGKIHVNYVLSSQGEEKTYVTDNISIPYGGYYPDNWIIKRMPFLYSFKQIYHYHKKRICVLSLKKWDVLPLENYRYQQQIIEKNNYEKGFFNPMHRKGEDNRITNEGCYRIWKELLLLRYLGLSLRYS